MEEFYLTFFSILLVGHKLVTSNFYEKLRSFSCIKTWEEF